MDLVHEFTFRATLKPPLPIGAGPIGTRMYYELSGGEVVGDRLRGAVRGGGEWALIGPDGYLRVDVRAQVETHDGAFLYVQYVGLLEMNAPSKMRLATRRGPSSPTNTSIPTQDLKLGTRGTVGSTLPSS